MKKRQSPICVGRIQLYAYGRHEEGDISFIDQFPYDDRRDFVVDKNFAGIAVKIVFYKVHYDKGGRRNVSVSLVDMTTRYEVASQIEKVILHKDRFECNVCINYSVGEILLVAGHTYRLIVNDISSSVTLDETMFRLFDQRTLGHPSKWYTVCYGAVRPSWESTTYKVLDTFDSHNYYVRFNVVPKISWFESPVLPELELRLYYPYEKRIDIDFREPKCYCREDYKEGIKTVEFPFSTWDDLNGIFYAELLCMEYPIAGFVFDSEQKNITGVWAGHEIKPLRRYSPKAAKKRLAKLLPIVPKSEGCMEDEKFDKLLDEFIESQKVSDSETEQVDS